MTYKELQNQKIVAMKEKNTVKSKVISSILATAKNIAIDEGADRENISNEITMRAILKEKKVCQDQIDTFPSQGNPQVLEGYKENMSYINEFAPKMLTEEETRNEILNLIETENIALEKGFLMRAIMPKLKGKAEGKTINKIVSEILSR